ncbi:hypothetical protein AGMMS50276_08360 [Synergistales bacterium]|nr:hypothetical protein AGMMS50276_08360 [Synergistales bacterium]
MQWRRDERANVRLCENSRAGQSKAAPQRFLPAFEPQDNVSHLGFIDGGGLYAQVSRVSSAGRVASADDAARPYWF